MVWYSHLFQNFPQFVMIHTDKGFSIVNEGEVNVFLKFPCFLYDPVDVGNLISGSSAFWKSSLYIWTFCVAKSLIGFPRWLNGREYACQVEDTSSIPGPGICLGEGSSNPLQYSCLANPMDREAWWARVHSVAKS